MTAIQQHLMAMRHPLSAVGSPTAINASTQAAGMTTLGGSITITPSGGVAPYGYSTVLVNAQGPITAVTSSLTSNPGVQATSMPTNQATGILRTTVADSLGATFTFDTPYNLVWGQA